MLACRSGDLGAAEDIENRCAECRFDLSLNPGNENLSRRVDPRNAQIGDPFVGESPQLAGEAVQDGRPELPQFLEENRRRLIDGERSKSKNPLAQAGGLRGAVAFLQESNAIGRTDTGCHPSSQLQQGLGENPGPIVEVGAGPSPGRVGG